jgi:hypothetical protein
VRVSGERLPVSLISWPTAISGRDRQPRYLRVTSAALIAAALVASSFGGVADASSKTRSIYYEGSVEGVEDSEVVLRVRQLKAGAGRWVSFRAYLVAKRIPEICSDGTTRVGIAGGHASFESRKSFSGSHYSEAPDGGDDFYDTLAGRVGKSAAHGWLTSYTDYYDSRLPDCGTDGRLYWRAERVSAEPR